MHSAKTAQSIQSTVALLLFSAVSEGKFTLYLPNLWNFVYRKKLGATNNNVFTKFIIAFLYVIIVDWGQARCEEPWMSDITDCTKNSTTFGKRNKF